MASAGEVVVELLLAHVDVGGRRVAPPALGDVDAAFLVDRDRDGILDVRIGGPEHRFGAGRELELLPRGLVLAALLRQEKEDQEQAAHHFSNVPAATRRATSAGKSS